VTEVAAQKFGSGPPRSSVRWRCRDIARIYRGRRLHREPVGSRARRGEPRRPLPTKGTSWREGAWTAPTRTGWQFSSKQQAFSAVFALNAACAAQVCSFLAKCRGLQLASSWRRMNRSSEAEGK
jgi:hypothetical protein